MEFSDRLQRSDQEDKQDGDTDNQERRYGAQRVVGKGKGWSIRHVALGVPLQVRMLSKDGNSNPGLQRNRVKPDQHPYDTGGAGMD